MKFLSRVVWSEGMYLGPHHFQAQSRYFEDSIGFAVSALWYQPYGLLGCVLDEEALRNGTLSLVQARGVFPTGCLFSCRIAMRCPPPGTSPPCFLPQGKPDRDARGSAA